MTDQEKIKGIIPPLTTPFTEDGQVYEAGLRELIEFQVQAGVHGLFICGTYGSGPIMTVEQRKQVAEIVVDQAKGRLAVIAHVGTTSTEQSVELAQHAERVGCDLVSAISPYYHRHDERTVVHFFDTLVQSVELPVYVYNNPKCSGVTITPSFLAHLAEVGVQGIKDSGFSFIDLTHFMIALQDRPAFRFIAGTEAIALSRASAAPPSRALSHISPGSTSIRITSVILANAFRSRRSPHSSKSPVSAVAIRRPPR